MRKRLAPMVAVATLIAVAIIPFLRSPSVSALAASPHHVSSASTHAQSNAPVNLVQDGGFEQQTTTTVSAPWGSKALAVRGLTGMRASPIPA